jgi:hypothetical protein
MNVRKQKLTMKKRIEQAPADVGGEPLKDSGFEDEVPEPYPDVALGSDDTQTDASPSGDRSRRTHAT